MDYGALTAARLRSGQWLHWGIRFFLAAALTASEAVDGYAPFALGASQRQDRGQVVPPRWAAA